MIGEEIFYFLELLVDEDNVGTFVSTFTQQLMSVPFAFHSKTTDQLYSLSSLTDVDTTGIQIGDILEWDGVNWVPGADDIALNADTAQFAYVSDSATYADTAFFAQNCVLLTNADSAGFAYLSDTANYAFIGMMAVYADSASYADTANVALYSLGNWGLNGNTGTDSNVDFLGTIDSVDMVFKIRQY